MNGFLPTTADAPIRNRSKSVRRLVIQNMLKDPDGLIRGIGVNEDGVLKDVHISGDFFFPSR